MKFLLETYLKTHSAQLARCRSENHKFGSDADVQKTRERIVLALNAIGPSTPTIIADMLEQSRRSVSMLMLNMYKSGELQRDPIGRGKSHVYSTVSG